MFTPQDLGLPFAEWNQYQAETIAKIAAARESVVFVQAPTGSGKSGLAVGLSRLLKANRTVICCHQKSLQDQYLRSFSELRTVRGRGNFPCLVDPKVTADDALCTITGPQPCPRHQPPGFAEFAVGNAQLLESSMTECPYYYQLYAGLEAPISIHNYAYWLIVANSKIHRFSNLDLLILDEGHLLESTLTKIVKIDFYKSQLNRLSLSWPTGATTISDYKSWASYVMDELRQDATQSYHFHQVRGRDVAEIKRIKSTFERAEQLYFTADPDWIIDESLTSISFRPVWVHAFGNDRVFRHSKKTVLLSATFRGLELECDLLGIDTKDARLIDVPSTFPAANRPVIFMPTVKVSYGMTEEDEAILICALEEILLKHPNEKGLVHTSNYKLATAIMSRIKSKRLITHGSKDREMTIQTFLNSMAPLVLVSPSMSTGLDLPDDAGRFIVWMKLPFQSKGDEQVARRLKDEPGAPEGWSNAKGQNWYMKTALADLIQGCGRAVRHAGDQATTYVLDANIKWFWGANKDAAPQYFKDAVRWENPTATLERQTASDFNATTDFGDFTNLVKGNP